MKTKKLPTVYVVQASDALQHAAKLHEILKKFVAEQRIGGFQTRTPGDDLSKLAETAGDEDLIIVMLTEQLEPDKEKLETALRALKRAKPDLKLSEIIVDNVVYDNEFITFPIDLKPIRDRMDMDAVWADMEVSLRQMFPANKQTDSRKKFVEYATIAGFVLLLVIFVVWLKGFDRYSSRGTGIRDLENVLFRDVDNMMMMILLPTQALLAAFFRMPDFGKMDNSNRQPTVDGLGEHKTSIVPFRKLGIVLLWFGRIGIIIPWLINKALLLTPIVALCFFLIMVVGLISYAAKKEYKMLPQTIIMLVLAYIVVILCLFSGNFG